MRKAVPAGMGLTGQLFSWQGSEYLSQVHCRLQTPAFRRMLSCGPQRREKALFEGHKRGPSATQGHGPRQQRPPEHLRSGQGASAWPPERQSRPPASPAAETPEMTACPPPGFTCRHQLPGRPGEAAGYPRQPTGHSVFMSSELEPRLANLLGDLWSPGTA
uniref:Uncharacterized protein n=1 Tax=Rangifer tarandus platyrhynchus TaxID=3082113 RepID=A0ACB0FH93_RANTA|nr:unnamed protein product [Rangifer tarandus platyrhynchus]